MTADTGGAPIHKYGLVTRDAFVIIPVTACYVTQVEFDVDTTAYRADLLESATTESVAALSGPLPIESELLYVR